MEVLEEKKLPISSYTLFASSNSKGKNISFMGKEYIIQELDESSFSQHFDYALFSAGKDVAIKYAPIAAENGCVVIDNSSAYRMDKHCEHINGDCPCKNDDSKERVQVFMAELTIHEIKELSDYVKDYVLELVENKKCRNCDYRR